MDGVVIPARELAARARRVRLVITDCDGVLTDGGVYYSEAGEALRRFSVRDGMGVELLREAGVLTALMTRERSASVQRRAEKLALPHLLLGVADKRAALAGLLEAAGVGGEAVAYIGDDVNDLGVIGVVGERGLTGAPADAEPRVSRLVHYRCRRSGGFGAFREFADWILESRRAARLEEEGA